MLTYYQNHQEQQRHPHFSVFPMPQGNLRHQLSVHYFHHILLSLLPLPKPNLTFSYMQWRHAVIIGKYQNEKQR